MPFFQDRKAHVVLCDVARGPGGVAQSCGSSRPAAAAARAATHHAAALMAGPGGPGSARFRSARSGRAGVPEAAAQQKPKPDAAAWTAERNDPGTGPGEVKAHRLRSSGSAARGFRGDVPEETVAISSKTELPKTWRFLENRQHLRQDS